jgi:hypothetical protein
MDVYTQKQADGTFVVVTESGPFDTFKAAKREELKQAKRISWNEAERLALKTCNKCKRSGVRVAEWQDSGIPLYICHECIAAAARRRKACPDAPFQMWGKQNLVEP